MKAEFSLIFAQKVLCLAISFIFSQPSLFLYLEIIFQLSSKKNLHRKKSPEILFLLRRTNIGKVMNVAFGVPATFLLW